MVAALLPGLLKSPVPLILSRYSFNIAADSVEQKESPYSGKAAASSVYGTFKAENVADGDENTRWSSDFSDPQWIMIDLQKPPPTRKD